MTKATHRFNVDTYSNKIEDDVIIDTHPWRHWPPFGTSEVREVRYATQAQAIAHGATSAVYAPRNAVYDPEPQPSDGPDYHDEHLAWMRRQQ